MYHMWMLSAETVQGDPAVTWVGPCPAWRQEALPCHTWHWWPRCSGGSDGETHPHLQAIVHWTGFSAKLSAVMALSSQASLINTILDISSVSEWKSQSIRTFSILSLWYLSHLPLSSGLPFFSADQQDLVGSTGMCVKGVCAGVCACFGCRWDCAVLWLMSDACNRVAVWYGVGLTLLTWKNAPHEFAGYLACCLMLAKDTGPDMQAENCRILNQDKVLRFWIMISSDVSWPRDVPCLQHAWSALRVWNCLWHYQCECVRRVERGEILAWTCWSFSAWAGNSVLTRLDGRQKHLRHWDATCATSDCFPRFCLCGHNNQKLFTKIRRRRKGEKEVLKVVPHCERLVLKVRERSSQLAWVIATPCNLPIANDSREEEDNNNSMLQTETKPVEIMLTVTSLTWFGRRLLR